MERFRGGVGLAVRRTGSFIDVAGSSGNRDS